MKYRTSDVRKILGISGETLRFFEKRGLIHPERNHENNYRIYNSLDLNKIVAYKFYRAMEFSMDEAIDMVNQSDSQDSLVKMEEQTKVILRKSDYYRQLSHRMAEWTKIMEGTKKDSDYRLEESPEIVFYCNQINKTFQIDTRKIKNTRSWLEHLPFVNLTVYIPVHQKSVGSETRIGYSIPSSNLECFTPIANENISLIPPKKSLRTILEISGNSLGEQHLVPILNDLSEESYTLNGDIFGYIINEYEKKGQKKQCFELWIPVE